MIPSRRNNWRDIDKRKVYTSRANNREGVGVTVCVAAMCEFNGHSLIIGASDRMVTAGDIQFEPQQPKIFDITSSIVIMTAGDSAMQAEILQEVRREAHAQVTADPSKWLDVQYIATLYSKYYTMVRLRKAESVVLAPLGLDVDTYISRQKQMSDTFIRQVATELYNFDAPHVAAIITGVDSSGAHIYVAHDADISCLDKVGFAAVGIGSGHADSQFMFSGHTRMRPYPETLLLTYAAKKRAEVAPGVGEATDMFVIGSDVGSYRPLNEVIIGVLETIYKGVREETQKAIDKSEGVIRDIVKAVVESYNQANSEEQATSSDGGDASSDSTDVRGIAETSQPETTGEASAD